MKGVRMKHRTGLRRRFLSPVMACLLLCGCVGQGTPPPRTVTTAGAGLLSGVERHVSDVLQQVLTGDTAARRMYGQWLAETGDTEKAREVLTPVAEKGDIRAQYQLGLLLAGKNCAGTRQGAEDWMRRSATGGLPAAQRTLGDWLTKGCGIPADPGAALGWYRKAAEQGDALAQNATGAALSAGRGTARDLSGALVWYRKAAEQGSALAALNLGNAYWTGSGSRANAGVAFAWYALAEKNARPDEGTLRRVAQTMKTRALMLASARGRGLASVSLANHYINNYERPTFRSSPLKDITE
ncbi:sel1 repeat family protein [Salmonella enterica subsp. enterica serovar Newport]|uniref:Sel1 repeat family protein n=2 Tax=Salmonella enterica TaxID=28901 RepID=A0A5Y2FKH3_SALNE|nr:sel1 repeat family protein [Salmonella enterica subsp. enterica serovar Newport]EBX1108233.1 sel1 repeat family protein [Salmonella enterica subsp. enterica serovar Salford]ECI0257327.1 sel1 repeat family protein [Salmonella enterica subsp. enterica]EBY2575503.1 sel1 repeat family protein [Salmonella enterica subsp. enterica serovar Newport]EBY5878296.1 sel1 repeat family protein [Salmonella enterica subsp. enterica serovar Newport]